MKLKICLLLMATALILSFTQDKTATPVVKKGMIKVTVLYPNGEGIHFDMDYYAKSHIPMVQRLFGKAMKGASIDKGIAAGAPGAPLPYLAIGYLYFDNIADFKDGMKAFGKEIQADIPKYTNTKAVIQISEVIQ